MTDSQTRGSQPPTTAEEFMDLPEGDPLDDRAQCYFVGEQTVMGCIDGEGRGWILQSLNTGQWRRVTG